MSSRDQQVIYTIFNKLKTNFLLILGADFGELTWKWKFKKLKGTCSKIDKSMKH